MEGPSTLRLRSGQAVDKLFAPLAGRPLLAHTLAAFQACSPIDRIALVTAGENVEKARRLIADAGFDKVAAVCEGGPRRQDSVRAGLDALGPCEWVVVHDGARPLVTPELIERGLEAARDTGAAVAAVPCADTVKEADRQGLVLRTVDRSSLWVVQTPQVFRYDLLRGAHDQVTDDVTDDAAMMEALGHAVRLYQGSRLNLKVTTPEDLRLAEAVLGP
ncbi:MAG: 2-C-methyl-D-erythritol 4-phosphate cytidylyltransferase [Chloroflexi bacterium]|nr:2-C-methyl-D-erythritol 4-phosphate cytidylyltransferase [Chloroflexota bacterium]